jgi:TonB family protein
MNLILETILRSSLVVTIGLAAVYAFRRQPAAFRHWILAAALALAAAQPAINLALPSWQVPSLRDRVIEAQPASPEVQTTFAIEVAQPPSAESPAPAIDVARAALWIWAVGAAISLGVLAFGALWLTWLGSRGSHASAIWTGTEATLRAHLGLRRPVKLIVTRHPALLVTWGAMSPVILLPEGANGWSADRVQLVMAHEMAHLVRRDWLVQLLCEVARALNWFNPLFWIACGRLRRESEHACDDVVLDLGIGGTSYASHLVDLARSFSVHGRTWLPAPSIARPSTLERRVRAMLNPQVDRRPVSRVRRVALATMLLAIALPIAAATQGPATPSGTVTDTTGRPLQDAAVRLNAVDSDTVFETKTDSSGAFEFAAVPRGEYLLSAQSMGFSGSRQRIALTGGGVTISMRLPVGNLRETVTVEGPGKPGGADGPRSEEVRQYSGPPACAVSAAGGHIIPPMKVKDVRPRYRQAWIDSKMEGSVLLQAQIGIDGRVRHVDVASSGNVELEDEAIAAVSQWEFSPTYLNCEPVEVKMFVTVSFKVAR